MIRNIKILVFTAMLLQPSFAEQAEPELTPWDKVAAVYPDWIEPETPFKVIGNIYYVGTKGIASFLVTSDQGHVLVDGGMPQNAPLIVKSVKELGFDIGDVKILLNSHAHFDHSGGLAELKQVTGATLIASHADTRALETGLYPGSNDLKYSAPPVKVDQNVAHNEKITLGDITLQAKLTPGHSPGCTSWVMTVEQGGTEYDVLFFGGASVAANRLVGPPQHPGIVEDYRLTFERTKNWRPDVLLSNHPFYFDLHAKRKRQLDGDSLAFVDDASFPKLIKRLSTDFEKALLKQSRQHAQASE